MHIFDQANSDGIPFVLSSNGKNLNEEKDFCKDAVEISDGQLLHSGSKYQNHVSCQANTYNAGNYYSWPTTTAGGTKTSGKELNSICAKGWMQAGSEVNDNRSFYNLIVLTYRIIEAANYDINYFPLSFARSGYFGDNVTMRGRWGMYYTSYTDSFYRAYYLFLMDTEVSPQTLSYYKNAGFSLRCGGVDKMVMV